MAGFYATTKTGIKALTDADVFGVASASTLVGTFDADPRAYYAVVPFIRRAVRLRANAVAGVPITLQKGEQDISGNRAFAALMGALANLIWKTEFALCLSSYGAYWRKQTNGRGLNPTPEWLLPSACYPLQTAERGLECIRYTHPLGVAQAGRVEQLTPDELVIFWHPSLDRANWPGPPPGLAALAASSALANRDRFVSDYFTRGAVKGTLLQVPAGTSKDERERLKSWWGSVVAGIRNAWRSNVVSTEVKPIVIGEGLAETNSDSLTRQYREDVAAALEIPVSMLLANSANFATAREERISFYEETVFPSLDMILTAINQQWLQPAYGVELIAHPEQTEAMQDAQVRQASAVTDLVGAPILTVDEGRAWLGLEPMAEQEQGAPDATEADDYAAMDAEAAQADAEEAAAEQPPVKALRGDGGRYAVYPGTETRTAERRTLMDAHAAARRATRMRHADERTQARTRHIAARGQAKDARGRLKLVHMQRAELTTLAQRHAAERGMLRSLQAAERDRMRERHAAQRAVEEVV